MKFTLAVQTAEYPNSVALIDEDGKVWDERFIEVRENSEKILPEITKNILSKNNLSLSDISKIGLCLGPGSYTGLRVGAAFVKGLVQFSKIRIIGVDAFEVLSNKKSEKDIVLFDAKNQRVYFKVNNKIKVDYLENALKEINVNKDSNFIGSGSLVNESYLANKFGKDVVNNKDPHNLKASLVGIVAINSGKEISVVELTPIYVQEARITESKKKI